MLIYERLIFTVLMGMRVCTIAVLIFEWVGYCSTFTNLGSRPRRILYFLTSIIISFLFDRSLKRHYAVWSSTCYSFSLLHCESLPITKAAPSFRTEEVGRQVDCVFHA